MYFCVPVTFHFNTKSCWDLLEDIGNGVSVLHMHYQHTEHINNSYSIAYVSGRQMLPSGEQFMNHWL